MFFCRSSASTRSLPGSGRARACHPSCDIANVRFSCQVSSQAANAGPADRASVSRRRSAKIKLLSRIEGQPEHLSGARLSIARWAVFQRSERKNTASHPGHATDANPWPQFRSHCKPADMTADFKWIGPESPARLIRTGGVAASVSLFSRECAIGCFSSHLRHSADSSRGQTRIPVRFPCC